MRMVHFAQVESQISFVKNHYTALMKLKDKFDTWLAYVENVVRDDPDILVGIVLGRPWCVAHRGRPHRGRPSEILLGSGTEGLLFFPRSRTPSTSWFRKTGEDHHFFPPQLKDAQVVQESGDILSSLSKQLASLAHTEGDKITRLATIIMPRVTRAFLHRLDSDARQAGMARMNPGTVAAFEKVMLNMHRAYFFEEVQEHTFNLLNDMTTAENYKVRGRARRRRDVVEHTFNLLNDMTTAEKL